MDTCVVCQSPRSDARPHWEILLRCQTCGHVYADVEPDTLDLAALYDEDYFHGDEYADYLKDRRSTERNFQSRLRDVRRWQPSGDLVEIGCAYGFFLRLAAESFRVVGYDVSEDATRHAREILHLDARAEDFVQADVPPGSADVVVMWDVVEHLPRPDLMLERVFDVLRPGGFVLLTTGDVGSALAQRQKRRWRLVHPPTHVHYFSKATLHRLFSRLGLRPRAVKYVSVRRTVRQTLYSLMELGKERPSALYGLVDRSPLGGLSFSLNTYDIMLAVAQKPGVDRGT